MEIVSLKCFMCTYFRDANKKRLDYLEWPEYFMAIAFLSAQRSKDPATQVDYLHTWMRQC